MKKERENTQIVLIDIQYDGSINSFECEYGENISYQEIEQKSYIEFKELMFLNINKDIKFRKFGRIGQVLTIKADMLSKEIDKFIKMISDNEIKLIHNWIISNITIIKDSNKFEENNKKMKILSKIDDDSEENEDE
jgi:hypothetical protein